MNKVNTSVFKLVNDVLQLISEEHDIHIDKLTETSRKIVEPITRSRCTGIVHKTGTRCCTSMSVSGTDFCRRHTPVEGEMEGLVVPAHSTQCESITNSGTRCVRNVKESGLCGVHMLKKNVYDCRHTVEYKCVHFTDDDDDDMFVCDKKIARNINGWFCKKHIHLQSLYARQYCYGNAADYVESIKNGNCVKRNVTLDNILNLV